MIKSAVQSIMKKKKNTGSPLPQIRQGTFKTDERATRHLERIIRKSPFVTYNQLGLELDDVGMHA